MSGRGGAQASGLLDVLQSTDEKLDALRAADLPQLREELLAEFDRVENQNRALADALAALAQAVGAAPEGLRTEPFGLIFFPPGEKPSSDPTDLTLDNLERSIPPGVSTFDFLSGEAKLAGGTTVRMSQSLNEIGASAVRSISAVADDEVEWFVPGQGDPGSGLLSRTLGVEGAELRRLTVQTFNETKLSILATTATEISAQRAFGGKSTASGGPPTFSSWDDTNDDPTIEGLDTTFAGNVIDFVPETAAAADAAVQQEIRFTSADRLGIIVEESGGVNAAELNLQAKTMLFAGGADAPDTVEDWTDVTGFTTSSPASIPAGTSASFEVDPWTFNRLRARVRAAAGTVDVAVFITTKEE